MNSSGFVVDGLVLPLSTESSVEIEIGKLSLSLWAEVSDEFRAREDLHSGYEGDHKVGFRIHCSGVCAEGVPQGEFRFEVGNCEGWKASLWRDGWQYSLSFTGTLTLDNGLAKMSGGLGPSWDRESPLIPLEVTMPLDIKRLDWSEYEFGSLQETNGMDSSDVRKLTLTAPDFRSFPPELLRLTSLQELSIVSDYHSDKPSQLAELGEELALFSELRSLTLHSTQLTALPDVIGQLSSLEALSVGFGQLESTPLSLWRLPNLARLSLEKNRLCQLPEEIDLPKLQRLDLSSNSLETLPESVVRLPELRALNLEKNPWKMLPTETIEVNKLTLSIEDKLRLLDFSYRNSKGETVEPWDDSIYLAHQDQALWSGFQSQLSSSETRLLAPLASVAKKGLRLIPGDEENSCWERGTTRIGGWPDLPSDWTYPRFIHSYDDKEREYAYEFLAQLDCEALASLQEYLPRSGWLYFFLDTVHEMNPLVLYFDGSRDELVSGSEISLEESDFYEFTEPPYRPFSVQPEASVSCPFAYSASSNRWLFTPERLAIESAEDELVRMNELGLEGGRAPHEINSFVFTQHEAPELQAALKKRGRPEDWVVLLKLASLGDFQWWDAGDLFFVIHKGDLARRDFSNIFCGLESS